MGEWGWPYFLISLVEFPEEKKKVMYPLFYVAGSLMLFASFVRLYNALPRWQLNMYFNWREDTMSGRLAAINELMRSNLEFRYSVLVQLLQDLRIFAYCKSYNQISMIVFLYYAQPKLTYTENVVVSVILWSNMGLVLLYGTLMFRVKIGDNWKLNMFDYIWAFRFFGKSSTLSYPTFENPYSHWSYSRDLLRQVREEIGIPG